MNHFISSVLQSSRHLEPTKMVLLTNKKEIIHGMLEAITDLDIIVLTNIRPTQQQFIKRNVKFVWLPQPPMGGVDILRQSKNLIVSLCAEGVISTEDRVLWAINTDLEAVISMDMKEIGITSLKDQLSPFIDIRVLESVVSIASEIAREGKEGHPAGALFIVGDSHRVIMNSYQAIRNPFASSGNISITVDEDRRSIKEFSLLDGATVIDDKGTALYAGRYILAGNANHLRIPEGLGGRHIAAAWVSKMTKAVAVVVSSTGPIRVFKDGEIIYKIMPK